VQQFYASGTGETDLLFDSEKYFLDAIKRNKADFKNYERLTDVYIHLAESSSEAEKTQWLERAFGVASDAVGCYPGCGRLHFKFAEIAEQLRKTDLALEGFKKAVEIEDAFRAQFKIMYPDREVFSRLGEGKYQTARQKVEQLSK
jgi:tetratricopeptide (TPR) repeat protein